MIGPQILFSRLTGFVSRYYGHPAYQPLWKKLEGHAIQVNVDTFGTWLLTIVDGRLTLSSPDFASPAFGYPKGSSNNTASSPKPTVTLTGPLRAFIRLAGTHDFVQAKALGLNLSGDLSLALSLAQVFKNPPIDFTERLSDWVGDHAAMRLTQWGSGLFKRLKAGPVQLADMSTEYLQEEARLLPTAPEIEDWMTAVDNLRDDVERFTARLNLIQALEKQAHAT